MLFQQYSDEDSSLSSLCDAESILQTLALGDGDSEAFFALESESDSEHNVQLNYRSCHDTPDDPREDDSEHTPAQVSETTLPILPADKVNPDQQSERTVDCIETPQMDKQSKEKSDCVPTPPTNKKSNEKNDHVPIPPTEKQWKEKNNHVLTPPPNRQVEKKEDRVPTPPPTQPFEENTMSYPILKVPR